MNDFYRDLLGTTTNRSLSPSSDFWEGQYRLDNSQLAIMDRPFTEKEVKDVVFSSNASKAPGLMVFLSLLSIMLGYS
jgi:hypothetical protein